LIATALLPLVPLPMLTTGPELYPNFAPNCRRLCVLVPLMQPCPSSQPPMPSRRLPSPARSCARFKTSSSALSPPPLSNPPSSCDNFQLIIHLPSPSRPPHQTPAHHNNPSHDRTRYECHTFCGIPEVTLLGSIADWTDLHSRFIVLAETWMHRTPDTCPWVKAVDEFLKQFIAARSGELWCG
jgi:hypothetical protein